MGRYKKQLTKIFEMKNLMQRGLAVLDLISQEKQDRKIIIEEFIELSRQQDIGVENSIENIEIWNQYYQDRTMKDIFEKSKSRTMFTEYLADYLLDKDTSIEKKSYILFGIQIDNRLPFIFLHNNSKNKGVINDTRYRSTLKTLKEDGKLNMLEYIMNIEWDYSTERSDRVIALMKGLSEEEKSVLLAVAFVKYEEYIHMNDVI